MKIIHTMLTDDLPYIRLVHEENFDVKKNLYKGILGTAIMPDRNYDAFRRYLIQHVHMDPKIAKNFLLMPTGYLKRKDDTLNDYYNIVVFYNDSTVGLNFMRFCINADKTTIKPCTPCSNDLYLKQTLDIALKFVNTRTENYILSENYFS